MNRPPHRITHPGVDYIYRNGVPIPIIDLEAGLDPKGAIDLTRDHDDDDEIVFTGWNWNTKNEEWKERERKREREEARARDTRRRDRTAQIRAGVSSTENGIQVRNAPSGNGDQSSVSMSQTPSAGPSSTIRPEIGSLGSITQRDNSEPRRKRLRTEHNKEPRWQDYPLPVPEPVPVKRESTSQPFAARLESDWYADWSNTPMDLNDSAPPPYEPPFEPAVPPAPVLEATPRLPTQPNQIAVKNPHESSPARTEPKVKYEDGGIQIKIEDNYRFKPQDDDEDSEETSSSDEYECIHSGFDLHDESRWKSLRHNPARFENDVIEAIEGWSLSSEGRKAHKYGRTFRTSRTEKSLRPPKCEEFIWDQLLRVREPAAASRSRQKPSRSTRSTGFGKIKSEKAMRVQASFKVAPGAVNRIEQHCGWLAIASACTGGQADEPDEEPNPYNRPGSLLTWNEQYHILDNHFDRKHYGKKYYTINDVKFNNSGHSFVSAGMDKKVCVWTRPQGFRMYSGGYDLDVYNDGVPYEVAFQPGNGNSNVVAVGVKDVHIYSSLEPTARRHKTVLNLVSNTHPSHSTGAIRWDNNRPHILYASSEPQGDDFNGIHKAFDLNRGKARLTFNVNEAGDAMAVHRVLALATRGEEENYLRLFDVTGFSKNCVQYVVLEAFPNGISAREVSYMTFSPDGVYLALARTDNSVHIYDSRMLGKGVLQKYRHQDLRFVTPENTLYGVTHAQWVTMHSGQHALLSGGEDGCVRLWNPMWSSEEPSNGRKIAEVNSDIGFFSVGDPFKEEHDLVVGDSSGEITIFTGLLNHL